ncbi:MAG: polyprenyl synthetase family protein [Parachlamydiaceae bacterium]|nr:polyprenyl synthetase family protein [Parachlamydiaceae bacterium]
MLLKDYLQNTSALLESHLDRIMPESSLPYYTLFSAARYSLLGGGKRLRPILLLSTAEALGAPLNKALSAASAVELVHTYSLIHDDLPCMDDDNFRRGKPSLHKAFSEAHAVLAGDFLLSYAFELLADDTELTAEQRVKLVAILAKGCGGNGMIGGQVLDIEAEGREIDLAALQTIHHHKTGALITASILMGAIVADAQEADLTALKEYGNALGLAFQIMDDVLDIRSSVEKHGKTTSSDLANNKTTYATLLGLEKAQSVATGLIHAAKVHLSRVSGSTEQLENLADFVINR